VTSRDSKSDPPGGISGSPLLDNIMLWNTVIFGPGKRFSLLLSYFSERGLTGDTPFEDGTFKLLLTFDESYPNKPPTVKFLSRMFHPNVYANGELCLDILQNRWSPTYDAAIPTIQFTGQIKSWVMFFLTAESIEILTNNSAT